MRRLYSYVLCSSYAARSRRGRPLRPLVVAVALALALVPPPRATVAHADVNGPVTLSPSLPSGQPVGTPIIWTATATDTVPLIYRFSVAGGGHPFTVVRDFSPANTFIFAPLQEGAYIVQVTVKEGYGATSVVQASAPFIVVSRVNGNAAVVSPTANPLVALYSAPPCAAGLMLVAFRALGSSSLSYTTPQACRPGLSENVYVAGMLPNAIYQMAEVIVNGSTITSAQPLSFTTGALPPNVFFPSSTVLITPTSQSDLGDPVNWNAMGGIPSGNGQYGVANPVATDLQGRILWYYVAPAPTALRVVEPVQLGVNGLTLILGRDGNAISGTNVLREIDLAGNPVRETNVAEINEQLAALGQESIYGFSHDALFLPNGDTAVLGSTLKTINGQDYMGDMLLVLDPSWQVSWVWDAFNAVGPGQLDLTRQPVAGRCSDYPAGVCPVPDPSAADWTHANTISYSAEDGDLLVSLRNQNWVVKIDYRNGAGDGHIVWRLGPGGDFSLPAGTDPSAWFSGQHDAHYLDAGRTITLFDNGNTRCNYGLIAGCDSRGQTWQIDEQTMVATPTVNIDLGSFSPALGSAERESNGNYDFTSGWNVVQPPRLPFGQAIEVLPDAAKVYVQQGVTQYYRSFRVPDLYHGTNPSYTTGSAAS